MFACPSCHQAQASVRVNGRVFWVCDRCGGRLVTVRLLRRLLDRATIEHYWWQGRRRKPVGREKRPCPSCGIRMREVSGPEGSELPPLDVCRHCQLVWFDPGEYRSLPPPPGPSEEEIEAELQRARSEELRREEAKHRVVIEPVQRMPWELPVIGLGLPLELEAPRRRRVPWLTLGLAAVLLVTSLAGLLAPEAWMRRLMFLPARPLRLGGLTLLTSFLLHGDLLHLFGNVYFLLTFGDNVEDYLLRWRYGLLLLQGHLLGLVLHLLIDPNPWVPVVGSSAGISGVITFYALRFPRAKILAVWMVLPLPLSAWAAFGVWMLLQSYQLGLQMTGIGHISVLAHLGGVVAGVVCWADEELPYRLARSRWWERCQTHLRRCQTHLAARLQGYFRGSRRDDG